jgi:hypothetical protein
VRTLTSRVGKGDCGMARLGWVAGVLGALAVACGGGGSGDGSGSGGGAGGGDPGVDAKPAPDPDPDPGAGDGGGGGGVVIEPPAVSGAFRFYGEAQGLSAEVWDVSADEGGNVYVAGGDAVFAKRRDDRDFVRFTPADAGLTRNCDPDGTVTCPIVSVAGAAAGKAIIGFKGIGTDGDSDPDWQIDSGGADVLAFDGERLTRTRHVHVAGVPQQFCMDYSAPPCSIGDQTYEKGRRKVRQVLRLAVNHDRSVIQYGDVWMAGSHGTFSVLVANPEQRGWFDLTKQFPGTEDRQYVWEHDHPAIYAPATINGTKQWAYLTGESTAIAIDPVTGDPWASNQVRTATKRGYGARRDGWDVGMWPPYFSDDQLGSHLDVWPDPRPANAFDFDALDPAWMDAVTSLSFCDDGTLWIASGLHGLARRLTDGTLSYVSLPASVGSGASAVACDPADGSIWVGFSWGGFGRYKDGGWWTVGLDVPAFAYQSPVWNIQIDRWSSPRIVYFAHVASRLGPGGVTAYDGR